MYLLFYFCINKFISNGINHALDLQNLVPGVYIVTLNRFLVKYTTKIIINLSSIIIL